MGKHPWELSMNSNSNSASTSATKKGTVLHSSNKMKVTVCFGNIRVIVPCPNREMFVRDLIIQATLRYRKATGKSPDSWLMVHKLKTQSDGGILDPDDKLVDVVDDREQIMAIYEEENDGIPSLQHNAGDGTSASSVGTSSPDIFQNTEHKFQPFERTDIEITGEEPNNNGGLTLQVRRGSEPALNRLSPIQISPLDTSKRWSAAPIIDEDTRGESNEGRVEILNSGGVGDMSRNGNGSQVSVSSSSRENSVIYNYQNHKGLPESIPTMTVTVHPNSNSNHQTKRGVPLSNQNQKYHSSHSNNTDHQLPPSSSSSYDMNFPRSVSSSSGSSSNQPHLSLPNSSNSCVQMRQQTSNLSVPSSRFSRDANRLSMQFAMDGKWADAADRALFLSLRKEPVGAATSPSTPPDDVQPPQYASTPTYTPDEEHPGFPSSEEVIELIIKYENESLGIHLIPEHRGGLIIKGVEPRSRIDRDGRLQAEDKIIEIDGHSLLGMPFQMAQELFKEKLKLPELRLKISRNKTQKNLRPSSSGEGGGVPGNHVQQLVSKFNGEGDGEEKENMIQGQERIVGEAKIATVATTRKSSPAPPLRSLPLMRQSTSSLISANTRKIERKYEIDLQKGQQGLGFSITTRDNPARGNCPIYIKNVLPTGAAIDDGRLRPGDMLLYVNGIEITGKSQPEAVSILRNIPQGGIVKLIVSRQERVDLSPKLPRQIPPEKVNDEDMPAVPWSEREILVLDIPVLDTEKAGLGISVKGSTTAAQGGKMVDKGIFIKGVINGGAASRDGRLKPNDQLLSVNEISLLDRSNTDAMETLRRTMTQDGPKPKPGFITLKIARRVASSSAPTTDMSACGSSASGDEMDSWGYRNVSLSADEPRQGANEGRLHQNHVVKDNQDFSQKIGAHSQNNGHNLNSSLRIKSEETPYGNNTNNRFPQHFPYHSNSIELGRNPVLERLTGKVPNAATRSESYYRATNEPRPQPLNEECPNGFQYYGSRDDRENHSVQVQNRRGELVLIENDYEAPLKPPRRSRSSTPEGILCDERKPSIGESEVSTIVGPNGEVVPSDATYASQTSLEEDAGGFARDAFGRQSMSEKRHATLDAKGTDTYQRNKKLREERERQRKLQVQMEGMNQKLNRERNSEDRRGTKRPFTSSNESELNHRLSLEQVHKTGERRKSGGMSFGEQLRELLHHWGQKQDQQNQRQNPQTHRNEPVILPRVGSADSLVESLKQHRSPIPKPPSHRQNIPHGDQRRSKKDIGPSLGMKKSSSLESLQTMVQEIQIQEDVKSGYGPLRSAPGPVRVVRGRGCNESFRQAVDRSYEAPLGDYENEMETLAEEETESCVSEVTSHVNNQQPSDYEEGIYGKKGGTVKKKPGLFRGLGSMFRFGRHRKSALSAAEIRKQQVEIERIEKEDMEQAEIDKARQAAQAENQRIQEQYRQLVERQKRENAGQNSPYGITVSISNKNPGYGTVNSNFNPQNNNLRPNHPFRKSMDSYRRCGHFRSVERDAYSSQRFLQPQQQQQPCDTNGNSNSPSHLRSASYDLYNEITRPGSRVGFVDPKKYSHYINYEEIRHHLNENGETGNPVANKKLSGDQIRQMKNTVVEQRKKAILESRRHQQHYHSQRREHPKERQERPVSNFYEYESVQAVMHGQNQSPPQQKQQQPIYVVRHNGNNNGVTLPSPTTLPFNSTVLRHRSPSQFQAGPPPFYATRQQQFITGQQQHQQQQISGNSQAQHQHSINANQVSLSNLHKQNSMPRRSHNGPPPPPSKPQQHTTNAGQRFPQQQLGLPGRYSMTHSSSSSNTHTHSHVVHSTQQQCMQIPSSSYTQQPPPPQQFVIAQNYQQSYNHNALIPMCHRSIPSTTSLGSKV